MQKTDIELLAPAGKWDVLEEVFRAGADAAYIGGKGFNMRMLNTQFNFSEQEIKNAVELAHSQNKKIYITVNSIYNENELNALAEYLLHLQEIKVDALIVQDLAVVNMHKELKMHTPLHASVQMGISNINAVKHLQKNKFTRAILSKNLSCEEIKSIKSESKIGLEFFVHGDLCVSHAGHCYISSFFSDNSGNKGKCIKPCRWPYALTDGSNQETPMHYYLANKDLCLLPYVKDLIEAGVTSFKIEGRMRNADYLSQVIYTYRQELDKIILKENKAFSQNAFDKLYDIRIRDFCSGNIINKPGIEAIGLDGEREPFFLSEALMITPLQEYDYYNNAEQILKFKYVKNNLSVKISNHNMLDIILKKTVEEIDTIILSAELMQRKDYFSLKDIDIILGQMKKTEYRILIETPHILNQEIFDSYWEQIFALQNLSRIDSFLINDLGSLELLRDKGFSVCAGHAFKIMNSQSVSYLKDNDLQNIILSYELDNDSLGSIENKDALELLVQGNRYALVTDVCYFSQTATRKKCSVKCFEDELDFCDAYGQKYSVIANQYCHNYIAFPYDFCLFPYLPLLIDKGFKRFRIDGHLYTLEDFEAVIDIYLDAFRDLKEGKWEQIVNYKKLLRTFKGELSAMPLFGKEKKLILG